MSVKVYLMAILDNYMFRPLLAICRLPSRELKKVLLYTLCAHVVQRSVHTVTAYHHMWKLHYAIRPVCRDLCTTCAHNVYSRTLSSLEDNLKMASKGRNM